MLMFSLFPFFCLLVLHVCAGDEGKVCVIFYFLRMQFVFSHPNVLETPGSHCFEEPSHPFLWCSGWR